VIFGAPCDCCVKTVKVLVRKDKTVKKKVWKPVIETVCDRCCNNCAAGSLPPGGMPPTDGAPLPVEPAISPAGDSGALLPPLPSPKASASWRRGVNSLLSAFAPTTRQR
jgi:hypothetical protein